MQRLGEGGVVTGILTGGVPQPRVLRHAAEASRLLELARRSRDQARDACTAIHALRKRAAEMVDHGRYNSPDLALAIASVANAERAIALADQRAAEAPNRAASRARKFAKSAAAVAAAAFADAGATGRVAAIQASVEHELFCAASLERGVLDLDHAFATMTSTKHAAVEVAKLAEVTRNAWLSGCTQIKALRSEARRLEAYANAMVPAAKARDIRRLRQRAEAAEARVAEVMAAESSAVAHLGLLTREAERLKSAPDDLCAFESATGKVGHLSKSYASALERLADVCGDDTGRNGGDGEGRSKRAQTIGVERAKAQKNVEQFSRRLTRARTELAFIEQWCSMSAEDRGSAVELEEVVRTAATEGRERAIRLLKAATDLSVVLAAEAEELRGRAKLAADHRARATKLRLELSVRQSEVSALKPAAVNAKRRAKLAALAHEQAVSDHATRERLVDRLREALSEARVLVDTERAISSSDAERAASIAHQCAVEAGKYAAEAIDLAERAEGMVAW